MDPGIDQPTGPRHQGGELICVQEHGLSRLEAILLPSYGECLVVSERSLGGDFGQIKLFLWLATIIFSGSNDSENNLSKYFFCHLDIFSQGSLNCDASLVLNWTCTFSNFLQPPCLSFTGDTRHI